MLNPYHVLSSIASLFPHSLSHAKGLSLSLQHTHSIEYMLSLPHIPSLCLPFPRTLFTPSHTLSYTHSPLSLPLTHTHVSPSHSLTISLSLLHAPFSLFFTHTLSLSFNHFSPSHTLSCPSLSLLHTHTPSLSSARLQKNNWQQSPHHHFPRPPTVTRRPTTTLFLSLLLCILPPPHTHTHMPCSITLRTATQVLENRNHTRQEQSDVQREEHLTV